MSDQYVCSDFQILIECHQNKNRRNSVKTNLRLLERDRASERERMERERERLWECEEEQKDEAAANL